MIRFYSPDKFIENYRPFDGGKIDVSEQMDAHEFSTHLLDTIEKELRGTVAEHILKEEFYGTEIAQIICQECEHVSERSQQFHAVPVKVQGRKNLKDCLNLDFIQGEYVQEYHCSNCNRRITALKRTIFGDLPPTLMIQLKRFEFSLETMLKIKINTRLEFPLILDMTPYCKEFIER